MKPHPTGTALVTRRPPNGDKTTALVSRRPAGRAILTRAGKAPSISYVTRDEALAAHEAADQQRPWRQRQRKQALLRFLWLSGARLSEALAVTPANIDTAAGVVNLRTLKRRQLEYRAIPLPPDELAKLLYVASHYHVRPDGPLWPWTRPAAWRWIQRAMVAAGIDRKRAHPHAFRHGHAMHAIGEGAPAHVVQAQLGHTTLVTTSIYTRAHAKDVRAFYDRIAW